MAARKSLCYTNETPVEVAVKFNQLRKLQYTSKHLILFG